MFPVRVKGVNVNEEQMSMIYMKRNESRVKEAFVLAAIGGVLLSIIWKMRRHKQACSFEQMMTENST